MQASPCRCSSGSHRQILCPLLLESTGGCRPHHDAACQPERNCQIVAQLPHFSVWVPVSTSLLHAFTYGHFGKGDAQRDNLVMCRRRRCRFPIAFSHNQLNGFEPLLSLRIVAIAHRDEAVTILREQLLGALLARFEMQAYPHGGRRSRGPGRRHGRDIR